MTDGPFHMVAHRYDDTLVTCSVYINNRPFLKPAPGERVSRRAAKAVVDALNAGSWPEQPLSRAELLEVK